MADEKRGGMGKKIIIVFLIIVVAVVVGFIAKKTIKTTASVVDSSKYQAVFLTNGQAYFGKVSNERKDYVSLNDVYYLILKQPLQNQKKSSQKSQGAS